jgi:hypothetical protein
MQTTNRKLGRAVSGGALLAGSAFIAALSFVAPSEALAACGGGTVASTGAKPPSTATGTHSGSTPSAGSTGTSSCGANTTSGALTSGTLTPSLAGVYTGAITGNGGKRNGSTTSSHTASRANISSTGGVAHTTNLTNTVHTASGGSAHGHFFHAGKHP